MKKAIILLLLAFAILATTSCGADPYDDAPPTGPSCTAVVLPLVMAAIAAILEERHAVGYL